MSKKKQCNNKKYIISNDLVEQMIIQELLLLKKQNALYVKQIEGTRAVLKIKDPKSWKGQDFYNYFFEKYLEKYNEEYSVFGSIPVAIKKLEEFIIKLNLSSEDYKLFIDKAFLRYFNNINKPILGDIASTTLYSKLSGKVIISAKNYESLNTKIKEESVEFENEVKNIGIYFAKKQK